MSGKESGNVVASDEELDEYGRMKEAAEINLYLQVLGAIIEMSLRSRVSIAINTIEEILSEDLSPEIRSKVSVIYDSIIDVEWLIEKAS